MCGLLTRACVTAICAFIVLGCACARAEPPSAEYQRYIDRGLDAYNAQRYAEARTLFEQAHAELPSARTLRALGITDYSLEELTLAERELRASLTHPVQPLTAEQREQVEQLLTWMQANLGRLRLEYTPTNARALVDEREVHEREVLLEPGEHRLRLTAEGFEPHEQVFHLVHAAEPLRLRVSLVARDAFRASTRSVQRSDAWLWVGGVSSALVVGGAVLGVVGGLQLGRVAESGPPLITADEIASDHSRGVWLTGIGIGLGAAGIAGLIWALVLHGQDDVSEPRASGWFHRLAPTGFALGRHF